MLSNKAGQAAQTYSPGQRQPRSEQPWSREELGKQHRGLTRLKRTLMSRKFLDTHCRRDSLG